MTGTGTKGDLRELTLRLASMLGVCCFVRGRLVDTTGHGAWDYGHLANSRTMSLNSSSHFMVLVA